MVARGVLLLACASCCGFAEASAATPITKVLELMNDMLAKGIAEKKEEETKFSAFDQWCTDTKRTKTDEIEEGNARIAQLKAMIEKHAAKVRKLTDRIEELDEDVGRWQRDTKSATEVRSQENQDYIATLADYQESLDALDEAIRVLKAQAQNTPQGDFLQALVQVQSRKGLPQTAKAALAAFLQQKQPSVNEMPSDELFKSAPEAYAYEFQSGGVVDMLVKLKDKFFNEKSDLMKDELEAKHAFEQIVQKLTDNIENANHEIEKKQKLRAQTEKAKAEAELDLTQTTKERDEDQKYLDDTAALCQQKTTDFQSRQELRAEEIKTLKMAIDIITSDTVAGSGERHLPRDVAFVQRRALAQVLRGAENPLQQRIVQFLSERAQSTGSSFLSQVSKRVAGDPFDKVKKLIKDLIVQLMEEATAETEHKGWCDTELATNKQTRERKAAEVEDLQNDIEDLTTDIAKLTDELATLAQEIKEIQAAMAGATEERVASKAKNEQTIQEAKEAQAAVQHAMEVVKAYYAKSAEATAFVQQTPAEDAPETFDKPYKGMFPEGGNVVDFLEVILTDFVRLESETTTQEAAEKATYDEFMFQSKKSVALKENDIGHKSEQKANKESALHQAKEDLETTQLQLDQALKYFDKLKPTCVHSGISYEARVKMREHEIQSLQEALKILSGEQLG